jgi:hypothetical protein
MVVPPGAGAPAHLLMSGWQSPAGLTTGIQPDKKGGEKYLQSNIIISFFCLLPVTCYLFYSSLVTCYLLLFSSPNQIY